MTPLPPSYDALQREVMDLRKRVDKLEREAEARAGRVQQLARQVSEQHAVALQKLADTPVKPLREPNWKTLGKRLNQDDDGA